MCARPGATLPPSPTTHIIVSRIPWHTPERHATGYEVWQLRNVFDSHCDAIVTTGAYRSIEYHRNTEYIESETGRLTCGRRQVEKWDRKGERSPTIVKANRHGRHPNGRIRRTQIDRAFFFSRKLDASALREGTRVADQPRREIEVQILRLRRWMQ